MFTKKPNNTQNKVCILTSVHPPFDIRIFHKEAKSLVKAGYNVTLVAQHHKDETLDGTRIVPLAKPKNRLERVTKTVWELYRKALWVNANIYHFHDPELIPIGLWLKYQGKKVIYDVHEDVPRQNLSKAYIPALLRKPISRMIEALEAFSARRFDGVVTATPFINRRFLELGANAVNVNNYPLATELALAENQWEKKEKAVCYVGKIAKIRGAYEMLEAIGKTEYKLILAGYFEPGLEDKLKQLPGWRQVEPLGFVGREGIRAAMSRVVAGLVLLHPTINYIDALPVKMFEYMSAGLPVIASDFPLWRRIIEGVGCGLLVDPLNPRAIAEAMRWILNHPTEAEAMGRRGRQAVEQTYNWDTEAAKIIGLYNQLLAP
jgi:glycosyltransferase involved in cell wall biosynthesis